MKIRKLQEGFDPQFNEQEGAYYADGFWVPDFALTVEPSINVDIRKVFGENGDVIAPALSGTIGVDKLPSFFSIKSKIESGKVIVEIHNPVLDSPRTGSALKEDMQHAFNDFVDNYAGQAKKFKIVGGDGRTRDLYQIDGSLIGKKGIFEWIVDSIIGVTHCRFIEGVEITGKFNRSVLPWRPDQYRCIVWQDERPRDDDACHPYGQPRHGTRQSDDEFRQGYDPRRFPAPGTVCDRKDGRESAHRKCTGFRNLPG